MTRGMNDRQSMTNQVIPEAAVVTMEGDKVLLNGHVMALIKGAAITADQIAIDRKAITPKEDLMNAVNARLKATK